MYVLRLPRTPKPRYSGAMISRRLCAAAARCMSGKHVSRVSVPPWHHTTTRRPQGDALAVLRTMMAGTAPASSIGPRAREGSDTSNSCTAARAAGLTETADMWGSHGGTLRPTSNSSSHTSEGMIMMAVAVVLVVVVWGKKASRARVSSLLMSMGGTELNVGDADEGEVVFCECDFCCCCCCC